MTEREWLVGCISEAEWLACRSLQQMPYNLDYCWERCGVLFAVACCRSVWHLLPDEPSKRTVVVAEEYAAGLRGKDELLEAEQKAYEAAERLMEEMPDLGWRASPIFHAMWATASFTGAMSGRRPVSGAGHSTQYAIAWEKAPQPSRRGEREAIQQFEAKRQWGWALDIFGNPFCPSPPLPAAVLGWNDSTVRRLVEGIYEERAFDRLPILADALLDAGCDIEELIAHCRSGRQHVRGCWAVDLILGRS
jgi:hypothetical protein